MYWICFVLEVFTTTHENEGGVGEGGGLRLVEASDWRCSLRSPQSKCLNSQSRGSVGYVWKCQGALDPLSVEDRVRATSR